MSRRVTGLPLLVAVLVTLVGAPQPVRLMPATQASSTIKAAAATGVPTAVAAPELSTFGLAAATATVQPPAAGWSVPIVSTVERAGTPHLLAYRGRAPPSNGVSV